jgi:hypothetical protein
MWAVSRKRMDKRCHGEIDSRKPTDYVTRFPGYESENCNHLENKTVAW